MDGATSSGSVFFESETQGQHEVDEIGAAEKLHDEGELSISEDSNVHVHFCGPDMSADDNLMCDDELNEIPLKHLLTIIGNTALRRRISEKSPANIDNNKGKRKTIAFAGKDYDYLFESESAPQRRLSYCDRIKIKSKFNVWKKLIQIRSNTEKEDERKKQINEFYLEKVKEGAIEDVKALFEFSAAEKSSFKFDYDAKNENKQSAVTIAILHRNLNMCKLLLKNSECLEEEDNLFYAIDQEFVEGVKLILELKKCDSLCIKCHHSYFQIGLTPLTLAALKNNYTIIKLLRKDGHALKEALNFTEGIQQAWEFRALRKLYWMTVSSPAYITYECENSKKNAMDYCMDVIEDLRAVALLESELKEFYGTLSCQVEEFMCHLLDQIYSSKELSSLFVGYEYLRASRHRYSSIKDEEKINMDILERACNLKLFKFVNHDNSQLILSYLLYRHTPYLRDGFFLRRFLKRTFIGLLFPLWSLFYLFAPHTKAGRIMKTPSIFFECYTMSSFCFLALLIINIVTKSVDSEYLGSPPTVYEIIMSVWVLSLWVQEVIEAHRRGWSSYIRDLWNWNDLLQLLFFSVWFVLRAVDYAVHNQDSIQVFRLDWSAGEPRLWSVVFLAYFYVFVFLRVLGFTRTNRILGPLRITLAKMLRDAIQFFAFFSLILFAFGIGLSELFWYYGSVQKRSKLCGNAKNASASPQPTKPTDEDCQTTPFSNLWSSLINLFWGIFGYLDPNEFQQIAGQHSNIEIFGLILLAAYYIAVILILINMLIAMMAKSYEVTSANEEEEWRFYRAVIWVRYIRGDFTSPPPMNLIPNFHYFHKRIRQLCNRKHETKLHKMEIDGENAMQNNAPLQFSTVYSGTTVIDPPINKNCRNKSTNGHPKLASSSVSSSQHTGTKNLIQRYKLHKLLGSPSSASARAKLSSFDFF